MKQLNEELEQTAVEMKLPYSLKAGIGYVLVDATQELKLTEYLKKADEAMYEMKKAQHKGMK